jgi:hypothetical protein
LKKQYSASPCELIKKEGFKTDEGLKAIVDLAWDMNKNGKNRKISKEQYLLRTKIY